MYPHEFTNIHAFVQRVALDMVRYGYLYYVTGRIPDGKSAAAVDEKIMAKYEIGVSKYTRARRKKKGLANIHYVRHQDFFVMLASAQGGSRWFSDEEWPTEIQRKQHGRKVRYVPRQPIVHGGYSISYKQSSSSQRGHVSVRIHPEEYRAVKAYFLDLALHRSAQTLENEFRYFPFEPYSLIRQQRWNILRAVNASRVRANYEPVSPRCLRKKRFVFSYMNDALGVAA